MANDRRWGLRNGHDVVRVLRSTLQQDGLRLLDVGCGQAGVAIAASRGGFKAIGIELDGEKLALAWARAEDNAAEVGLVQGDATRAPLRPGSFDVAVLYNLIEHLPDPEAMLAEVYELLAPGGVAFLAGPKRSSLLSLLRDPHYHLPLVSLMPRKLAAYTVVKLTHRAELYGVTALPTVAGLRSALRRTGFVVTDVTTEYLRVRLESRSRATLRMLARNGVIATLLKAVLPSAAFIAQKPLTVAADADT